jgi:hypothetical protein
MKRYIAIWRQRGQGCGHAIGCGVKVEDLGEHENMDAATKAASNAFLEEDEPGMAYRAYLAPDAFQKIVSITVYEIAAATEVDLDAFRRAEKARQKQEREDAEREEYERLRKKFGP